MSQHRPTLLRWLALALALCLSPARGLAQESAPAPSGSTPAPTATPERPAPEAPAESLPAPEDGTTAPTAPTEPTNAPTAPTTPATPRGPRAAPAAPAAPATDATTPPGAPAEPAALEGDAGVPPAPPAATAVPTAAPVAPPPRETIVVQVPAAPAPQQQIVQVPIPMAVPQAGSSDLSELLRTLVPGIPLSEGSGFGLILLAGFALGLLGYLLGRLRERLPRAGLIPRALSLLHFFCRAGVALAFFLGLIYLIPHELLPVLTFVICAAGAAIGWSTRDVAADYLAGLTLFVERRLKRGAYVVTGDYAGVVKHVGLRVTWIRDPSGLRVAVPNRKLLAEPLLLHSAGVPEREFAVCIASSHPAAVIREALRDGVITSPYVHGGVPPTVSRDPLDPKVWRVRARLLHPRYATTFEGQLLERTEEMLATREVVTPRPRSSTPPPPPQNTGA